MKSLSYIYPCEICGKKNWMPHYEGPVRDGPFSYLTAENHIIFECGTCGIQRLEESGCKEEEFYRTNDYRTLLRQATGTEEFWEEYDALQIRHLNMLWPNTIRNKAVADIGCAAGSFLDHIKGLAACCVAIEPCKDYHESLLARGYRVFSSSASALHEMGGKIDFAFSFSVIEHVVNPRVFLSEIRELLSPGGVLLISTPNRDDILMHLLENEYRSFFYRTVHRWYFHRDSFAYLAENVGLEIVESQCLHRFGISNTMAWLRDRKPTGDNDLPNLDDIILNEFWRKYLESKFLGDYLYFLLRRTGLAAGRSC
jgi:2-polyprenyl-3-methyl-5-hydroxy-6-metoxy-1,4-benzoquinol methylase